MQRKTAKKEPWRPKCAAPRLVYDSGRFFQTFMHVYVRTTDDQIYSAKKKGSPPPPEARSRDGHVEHVCKISESIPLKRRGHLDFCAENMCILRS